MVNMRNFQKYARGINWQKYRSINPPAYVWLMVLLALFLFNYFFVSKSVVNLYLIFLCLFFFAIAVLHSFISFFSFFRFFLLALFVLFSVTIIGTIFPLESAIGFVLFASVISFLMMFIFLTRSIRKTNVKTKKEEKKWKDYWNHAEIVWLIFGFFGLISAIPQTVSRFDEPITDVNLATYRKLKAYEYALGDRSRDLVKRVHASSIPKHARHMHNAVCLGNRRIIVGFVSDGICDLLQAFSEYDAQREMVEWTNISRIWQQKTKEINEVYEKFDDIYNILSNRHSEPNRIREKYDIYRVDEVQKLRYLRDIAACESMSRNQLCEIINGESFEIKNVDRREPEFLAEIRKIRETVYMLNSALTMPYTTELADSLRELKSLYESASQNLKTKISVREKSKVLVLEEGSEPFLYDQFLFSPQILFLTFRETVLVPAVKEFVTDTNYLEWLRKVDDNMKSFVNGASSMIVRLSPGFIFSPILLGIAFGVRFARALAAYRLNIVSDSESN